MVEPIIKLIDQLSYCDSRTRCGSLWYW